MKYVLCSVLVLALAGCGTSMMLNDANLNKVQNDMSQAEVTAILGAPTESKTDPIPIVGGTQTTYTYRTSDGKNEVTIVFKNDKEQEKHGSFNQ